MLVTHKELKGKMIQQSGEGLGPVGKSWSTTNLLNGHGSVTKILNLKDIQEPQVIPKLTSTVGQLHFTLEDPTSLPWI